MQFFSYFLKRYNNNDFVPTLEAMQKTIECNQNKRIDMLKLGCTLPNYPIVACISRQVQNFIPLQSRIKIWWKRYEEICLAVLLLSLHVKL